LEPPTFIESNRICRSVIRHRKTNEMKTSP
jgi:hypothetical protein